MKARRKFTKEFKQTAVRRLNSGQSTAEVARALEVHPSDLHRWRRELQEHGERAFNGAGKKRGDGGGGARQIIAAIEIAPQSGQYDVIMSDFSRARRARAQLPSRAGNERPCLSPCRAAVSTGCGLTWWAAS